MSEKVGPVTLSPREDPFLGGRDPYAGFQKPYSEQTAQLVDAEIRRILQECYQDGIRLIRLHRDALDRLAQALLEHETLDEQEIIRVTGIQPAPRAPEVAAQAVAMAAFTETRPNA
jgi:cell division protease FtsH